MARQQNVSDITSLNNDRGSSNVDEKKGSKFPGEGQRLGDAVQKPKIEDRKVFVYLLNKKLQGMKEEDQKAFAEQLIMTCDNKKTEEDAYDDVNEIFRKIPNNPLMALIWNFERSCGLLKGKDYQAKIYEALKEANLPGVEVTNENLKSFNEKIGKDEKNGVFVDLTSKNKRLKIYRKLASSMPTEALLIGHFLLSIQDFCDMDLTGTRSKADLVQDIFKKWDERTESSKRTWNTLRSVLLGLGYNRPVEEIENEFGDNNA